MEMIEWGKMFETFIAAAAGAAAIIVIDWGVKYYLYKKKNFQIAISIQLALHQMLAISLQVRKFYDDKQRDFLKSYSQDGINGNPEDIWVNFRHIDLPSFMNTFDIISFDWNFTQFLSGKENKTRKILRYLIPAKLGFQSLMSIIKERNELVWFVLQRIELFRSQNHEAKNFEYTNNNLSKIIGLPINEKLRGMTDKYVEIVNHVIVDCNKAFEILSVYISENFCHVAPLDLNIADDMRTLLNEIMSANNSNNAKKG